nr:PAS domain-containing protein [Streptomyces sp. WAC04657]
MLVNCNGTVVNANTIALGMFETPGTALVGRGLLDLLPDFDSRLIPGSMRRPDNTDERGRTKPTRMVARRTDGGEFPVEVTSASLEDGREAYDSYGGYTGDELLMLVVRDLTGTVDTEAELARSQRQTEMILRAASEGVVGTDTDGRVVLVNPAAAQILGHRAGELGGRELHPLILAKRADGEPFPYEESPLADTLKSGRKHRVRGQVLWTKKGERVPVDLTTAPVRDGDQLVGAVMTFTDRRPYEQLVEQHAAELADRAERAAAEREAQQERYASLAARHEQLTAVLAESLRGPLEELRTQLGALAADDAGQLWPEANQVLHHLAAGYARMTALVDNVLGYQRLDAGAEGLDKHVTLLDGVVSAGIDGAVELIGPGRAQFAVHTPPIEAEVDPVRLATALAHLVADVAGVDATGRNRAAVPGAAPVDSTIVVAAAQRGDVVRIEVRGPYAGGDPVHGPVVRGIVAAHGGVVQTHEVPGTSGGAYVLEVPVGAGRGTVPAPAPTSRNDAQAGGREALALPAQASGPAPEVPAAVPAPGAGPDAEVPGGGRRRARRGSTDAFLESAVAAGGDAPGGAEPSGRRRARTGGTTAADLIPAQQNAIAPPAPVAPGAPGVSPAEPTGRRRGRPAEGSVVTAAEGAQGRAALGAAVPPQGVPVDPSGIPGTGNGSGAGSGASPASALALPAVASEEAPARPSGRRRRALAAAQERAAAAEAGPRTPFALPPADADREVPLPAAPVAGPPAGTPIGTPAGPLPVSDEGQHEVVRGVPGADHTPPQPHPHVQTPLPARAPDASAPLPAPAEPTGRRRAVAPPAPAPAPAPAPEPQQPQPVNGTGTGSVPLPPELPMPRESTQGRAFSVRTLGQGVPFVPPAPAAPATPPPARSPGGPGSLRTDCPDPGSGVADRSRRSRRALQRLRAAAEARHPARGRSAGPGGAPRAGRDRGQAPSAAPGGGRAGVRPARSAVHLPRVRGPGVRHRGPCRGLRRGTRTARRSRRRGRGRQPARPAPRRRRAAPGAPRQPAPAPRLARARRLHAAGAERPRLPAGDRALPRGGRRADRRLPGRALRRPADRAHHPYRAPVAAPGRRRRRGAGTARGRARTGDPRGGVRRRSGRTPQGARAARQRAAPVPGPAHRGERGHRGGARGHPGAARDAGGAGGHGLRGGHARHADAAEPGGDGPDAGAPPPGRDHRLAAGERAAQPHPARRLHLGRPGRGGAAEAVLRRDGSLPRRAREQRRGPGPDRRPAREDRHQLGPTRP